MSDDDYLAQLKEDMGNPYRLKVFASPGGQRFGFRAWGGQEPEIREAILDALAPLARKLDIEIYAMLVERDEGQPGGDFGNAEMWRVSDRTHIATGNEPALMEVLARLERKPPQPPI